MTDKDKATALAEKHGTLHSNLNQTFVTLHEKGLQTLLADHRQQVIEELAQESGVMPMALKACEWVADLRTCSRDDVREVIAAMQAKQWKTFTRS